MTLSVTPSRTLVNSTSTGAYKPPVMGAARPAGHDHLKHKSLGVLTGKAAV